MKKLLSFTFALILGVIAFGFQSCGGGDDEPNAKIAVTQSEIQGSWHSSSYGYYHHFYFNDDSYSYSRMDARTTEIKYSESGTYTLSGMDISFKSRKGSSELGGTGECEIYWEDGNKSHLRIYPMGLYERVN